MGEWMSESWRETQRHECIDEWLWSRVSGVGTVITIHMALQEWGPFTPDTGSTASRLQSALSRRKPPSLHLPSFPGQPTSDNWSAWGCEHWALFTRLRRALKAHPSFRAFSGSTEGSTRLPHGHLSPFAPSLLRCWPQVTLSWTSPLLSRESSPRQCEKEREKEVNQLRCVGFSLLPIWFA